MTGNHTSLGTVKRRARILVTPEQITGTYYKNELRIAIGCVGFTRNYKSGDVDSLTIRRIRV